MKILLLTSTNCENHGKHWQNQQMFVKTWEKSYKSWGNRRKNGKFRKIRLNLGKLENNSRKTWENSTQALKIQGKLRKNWEIGGKSRHFKENRAENSKNLTQA